MGRSEKKIAVRYNISFSGLAERKLFILLQYLIDEWSVKAKNDFREKLEDKLHQIAVYPESCKKSKVFFNLHQCIVTKQTSFLYRIKNTEIEIITVFDNRSNFKSINTEIRSYYNNLK